MITVNSLTPAHLVAHRGNAADFPENTLASLQSAVALGVHHLEFDVQLAADLVPVVIHDDTLARTAAMQGSVFERTANELSAIDVSEVARFKGRHRNNFVPSLARVVAWLGTQPDVTAFVEVKRASLRRFGHEQVMSAVLEALRAVHTQCVVISFDAPAVEMARTAGFASGWVLSGYDDISHGQCEILQPDYLLCNHEKLPADGSRLWAGPWRWALYEVETVPLAERLICRGAALIETMAVAPMTQGLGNSACGATTS